MGLESHLHRDNSSASPRKEGNVLFNDTLNTFYLRLYGIRHMVKDHSDSEKGNPLPPHRLLFPINSKGSFICTIPDRIAHTTAFVTPVMEHWLEREIAQWVHPMKDRSDDPSHHERTLLPRSYISFPASPNLTMNNNKNGKQFLILLDRDPSYEHNDNARQKQCALHDRAFKQTTIS